MTDRRRRVTKLTVRVGIVALLVAAACAAPAGAAAGQTACSLLSPADLHGSFSGTIGTGDLTTGSGGGETICQWLVTEPNGGGFAVQLDVKSGFSRRLFAQQRKIASGPTKTVKHLGNAAFSERTKVGGQTFVDLWVLDGTTAFRVEVLKNLGAGRLVPVAKTVIAHLASP